MIQSQKTVEKFERSFADYLGIKYAVAVSSGTAALHAALYAAGVSHKDEVILSPLAHPETAHGVRYLDGVPMYTDIDPRTGCLDPEAVRWRISANTKAILASHYAGQLCDMEALEKVAAGREIVIIENASQALGAAYRGKKIGTLSSLTVFDFSYPQSVCTELGGMVVTDSEEHYRWLTLFRDTGIMSDRKELVSKEGPWHFEAQEIGFNYRITGMQAEKGLSQLQEADEMQACRRQMAQMYYEALEGVEGIELTPRFSDREPAWYSFPVLVKEEHLIAQRRSMVEEMLAQGIPVDVQYYPIYQHPIYQWQGHPDICTIDGPLCPKAEEYYKRVINLPVNPKLDNELINKAITFILKAKVK